MQEVSCDVIQIVYYIYRRYEMNTVEKRKWCMRTIERYGLELQQQSHHSKGTRYTVYKPKHFGLLAVCDGLSELYLFLDGYDAGMCNSTFKSTQ